jgi:hypothetical protein
LVMAMLACLSASDTTSSRVPWASIVSPSTTGQISDRQLGQPLAAKRRDEMQTHRVHVTVLGGLGHGAGQVHRQPTINRRSRARLSQSRPPPLGRPAGRPSGPSHAIGSADPRPGIRSTVTGSYREDGSRTVISPGVGRNWIAPRSCRA